MSQNLFGVPRACAALFVIFSLSSLLTACLPDPAGDDLARVQQETAERQASEADVATLPAQSEDRTSTQTPLEEVTFCATVYDPVCARQSVECVTGTCLSNERIFANACEARKANYTNITQGRCANP